MGDEQILSQVPLWSLAGIGFCQGQFFMVRQHFGLALWCFWFDRMHTITKFGTNIIIYLGHRYPVYLTLTVPMSSICDFTYVAAVVILLKSSFLKLPTQ